ncbi:MAG: hypothetical protein ACOVOR_02530 [Rhabdochlamydiaceae bacterium]
MTLHSNNIIITHPLSAEKQHLNQLSSNLTNTIENIRSAVNAIAVKSFSLYSPPSKSSKNVLKAQQLNQTTSFKESLHLFHKPKRLKNIEIVFTKTFETHIASIQDFCLEWKKRVAPILEVRLQIFGDQSQKNFMETKEIDRIKDWIYAEKNLLKTSCLEPLELIHKEASHHLSMTIFQENLAGSIKTVKATIKMVEQIQKVCELTYKHSEQANLASDTHKTLKNLEKSIRVTQENGKEQLTISEKVLLTLDKINQKILHEQSHLSPRDKKEISMLRHQKNLLKHLHEKNLSLYLKIQKDIEKTPLMSSDTNHPLDILNKNHVQSQKRGISEQEESLHPSSSSFENLNESQATDASKIQYQIMGNLHISASDIIFFMGNDIFREKSSLLSLAIEVDNYLILKTLDFQNFLRQHPNLQTLIISSKKINKELDQIPSILNQSDNTHSLHSLILEDLRIDEKDLLNILDVYSFSSERPYRLIKNLKIVNCHIVEKFLFSKSQFPILDSLEINNCLSFNENIDDLLEHAPLLKSLYLKDLPHLNGSLSLTSESSSTLEHLTLINMPGLGQNNTFENLKKLPHLKSLEINNCYKIKGEMRSTEKFPSLEQLYLTKTGLPIDIAALLSSCPALKELHLTDSKRIIFFPISKKAPSFQKLSTLIISNSLVNGLNMDKLNHLFPNLIQLRGKNLQHLSLDHFEPVDDFSLTSV